jgi:hypothetical protein
MTVDSLGEFASAVSFVDDVLAEQGSFAFKDTNLPVCPSELTSPDLIIRKGRHDYNGYFECDAVGFIARRETYRQLAILVLSTVFHDRPEKVRVTLTHPTSDVRQVIVESERYAQAGSDLVLKTHEFSYTPSVADKHPFTDILPHVLVRDLPCFFLTVRDDTPQSRGSDRDTLVGFGTAVGHTLLAELLLNASDPSNQATDFQLECEAGFRGVGPMSAEACFILPGSVSWFEP